MKVVIFEDEKLNAERLVQLLREIIPQLSVVNIIESVAQGKKWFLDNRDIVDIAFMDIQLSDGNCFELLQTVPFNIPIIFTTAYDNFALQAFKVHSIDYLVKPIDRSELVRALDKYNYFRERAGAVFDFTRLAEAFYRRENTRFIGRVNNQIIYVKSQDIAYVYFNEGITKAVTHSGRKVPVDYTLDQMDKLLNNALFFRINRRLIVNIDAIVKINSYNNSRLILHLLPESEEGTFIVSRERVSQFKAWLEGRDETL